MRKLLVYVFLLMMARTASGQIDWGAYSQSYPEGATDDPSTVALLLAIPQDNNSFWALNADSRHSVALARDSAFLRQRPAGLLARTTFDTARAHFFLHGVTPANAAAYQFRVIAYPTNRVWVPWQRINRFTDSTLIKSSGLPRMGYLGGYKAPLDHALLVDVRQARTGRIVGTTLISWVPIKPVISNVYTSDNLDAFFKKLQYPWARETDSGRTSPSAGPFTLPSTNTNLVLFLAATLYHKEQVQYELLKDGRVVIPWRSNEYDNSFVWLRESEPGSYELRLRYAVQPQHVTTFSFEVKPAWYQSTGFRIMVSLFVVACLGALAFFLLYIQQKRKSRQALTNKAKLQLELKAIYAQLNPHFVFNALSSIQGLINKQDIQGANNYLSDFARLMRESLNNSNREEISLHEEIRGLDTYLRLEQLRFGFGYEITVVDTINQYDSSIPALLLQPLVENAVKHGAGPLGKAGRIRIAFDQTGDSMRVGIADNGLGYTPGAVTGGFGLKLTRDRINLLNQLQPSQPISMEVLSSSPTGTEISLNFSHWFA